MIIPGFLVSLATFPGVIVHEAAHMFFCKLRGVAVLDVCFFRVGNPSGYVIHEEARDFTTSFLICVGPLFVNSLFCVLFCFPAFVPYKIFDIADPLIMFQLWLGISIGMHAFPSTGDAAALWHYAGEAAGRLNPLALVSYPLVVLIYIANGLSLFWFDLAYGFALGVGLPTLILESMA